MFWYLVKNRRKMKKLYLLHSAHEQNSTGIRSTHHLSEAANAGHTATTVRYVNELMRLYQIGPLEEFTILKKLQQHQENQE